MAITVLLKNGLGEPWMAKTSYHNGLFAVVKDHDGYRVFHLPSGLSVPHKRLYPSLAKDFQGRGIKLLKDAKAYVDYLATVDGFDTETPDKSVLLTVNAWLDEQIAAKEAS
jgi:hypothetical protein